MIANIDYNDDGKAILSELNDNAERVEVSYSDTEDKASVKFYRDYDVDAYREEEYSYGKYRGVYKLTQKEITVCDDCELSIETWEFNDDELLERHTSPAGIITEYSYDDEDRKISQTNAVGTAEEQTTTYTWNDTHNQIETITTPTEVTSYTFDDDGNRLTTTITPVQ
ncbi:hypothetical protein [Reinekea marinisedimentorum]|uniref:YD repeat-containing protein n=1 Tax=Reinekea marinisedimentorum TaxID=230495 RepID=A0A4R3HVC7_9GAMM|nr:hypothetical protein [Reinekea marinisedimentorum]TCS36714.1 YD repeat-containing protein [Reinekea marinisedimentorum]